MKWIVHRLKVAAELSGMRLDRFIAASVNDISRTQAKKIIDLGGVHVNGRRSRSCAVVVAELDRIEVYLDRLPLDPYRLDAGDICYQDAYLIVLNKPAQVDTQPTHARYKGTLYEALQQHLHDPFRRHVKPSLGMVQRLDRGTTGLMVFSLHPRAHKSLSAQFAEQQVDKRYLALVAQAPPAEQGEIRSQLARTRKDNRVRSVAHGGRLALTRYQIRERFAAATLVELELLTGRSHQIRAHMAEQGCPLLGDLRYGGPVQVAGVALERPMLHANKLAFRHPLNDKLLEFTVEPPADMQRLCIALRHEELD
jgi:23S rRNA pseudouridine1911/1915/1917 synthase